MIYLVNQLSDWIIVKTQHLQLVKGSETRQTKYDLIEEALLKWFTMLRKLKSINWNLKTLPVHMHITDTCIHNSKLSKK